MKKIPLDKAQFFVLKILNREVLEETPARAFRGFFFKLGQIPVLLRLMKIPYFKFILIRILDFGTILRIKRIFF